MDHDFYSSVKREMSKIDVKNFDVKNDPNCDKCKGTGMIRREIERECPPEMLLHINAISENSDNPNVRDYLLMYDYCECENPEYARLISDKEDHGNLTSVLYKMNIPHRYQLYDLNTFDGVGSDTSNFIANGEVGNKKGIFLIGFPNTGKTHLAVAMLQYFYFSKKELWRFVAMDDYFDNIKESYNDNGESESETVKYLLEFDGIVLDDIVPEKITEWVVEKTAYLINKLYVNDKKIIITSNQDIDFIRKTYGDKTATRILAMAYPITLDNIGTRI